MSRGFAPLQPPFRLERLSQLSSLENALGADHETQKITEEFDNVPLLPAGSVSHPHVSKSSCVSLGFVPRDSKQPGISLQSMAHASEDALRKLLSGADNIVALPGSNNMRFKIVWPGYTHTYETNINLLVHDRYLTLKELGSRVAQSYMTFLQAAQKLPCKVESNTWKITNPVNLFERLILIEWSKFSTRQGTSIHR